LKAAQDRELRELLGQDIGDEWHECFEAVSLLHADILEMEPDLDAFDTLACRVEDLLFGVKEDLSKRLKKLALQDEHEGSMLGLREKDEFNVIRDESLNISGR